jgi:6-pyruvoyltetrahydropterin/6-carboxytetrahydropterin synthase
MILDFGIMKKLVNEQVVEILDHSYLNEIIPQSTTENLAQWIWERLDPVLKGGNYSLSEIVVWETDTSFVTLRREGSGG